MSADAWQTRQRRNIPSPVRRALGRIVFYLGALGIFALSLGIIGDIIRGEFPRELRDIDPLIGVPLYLSLPGSVILGIAEIIIGRAWMK